MLFQIVFSLLAISFQVFGSNGLAPDFKGSFILHSKIESESICAPYVQIEIDQACTGLKLRMGNSASDLYGFVDFCHINQGRDTDARIDDIAGVFPYPNLQIKNTKLTKNEKGEFEILATQSTVSFGVYREAKRLTLSLDGKNLRYETSSIKHNIDRAKMTPEGSYYEGCEYIR